MCELYSIMCWLDVPSPRLKSAPDQNGIRRQDYNWWHGKTRRRCCGVQFAFSFVHSPNPRIHGSMSLEFWGILSKFLFLRQLYGTLRIYYAALGLKLISPVVPKFLLATCIDLVGHFASGRVSRTSEPSPSPSGHPDMWDLQWNMMGVSYGKDMQRHGRSRKHENQKMVIALVGQPLWISMKDVAQD